MNLYDLLPTIYRRRDAELYDAGLYDADQQALEGGGARREALNPELREYVDDHVARTSVTPLKALLAILQSQYDLLERDIGALYDDSFVETCSAEALALLAEPFAIADLDLLERGGGDTRAIVANILEYRSKKGSAGAFEAYARDATRWAVRVADRLTTTTGTTRVDGGSMQRNGYPDLRRGKAVFTWRPRVTGAGVANELGPRSVEVDVFRVRAARVTDAAAGYARPGEYQHRTFSPLGDSKVLMCPSGESGQGAVPYTRENARAALAAYATIPGIAVREHRFFGAMSVPPLRVADLSSWARPRGPADPGTVFVDPELGRLLTPRCDAAYAVDYWLATNDGIGAAPSSQPWSGTYDRTLLVAPARDADAGLYRRLEARLITRLLDVPEDMALNAGALSDVYFDSFATQWAFIAAYADRYGVPPRQNVLLDAWPSFRSELVRSPLPTGQLIAKLLEAQKHVRDATQDDVHEDATTTPGDTFERVGSLAAALRAAEAAAGSVRIVLRGSRTHGMTGGGWTFKPKRWLTKLSIESAPGARPTLAGPLRLLAETPRETPLPIELRGLNVGACITCSADVAVTIDSCTLRPFVSAWSIEDASQDENEPRPGTIRIVRSIVGGARLGHHTTLSVEESIVTEAVGALQTAPGAPGPALDAKASTFLAAVTVDRLTASDVLFDTTVTVRSRRRGYARYCVVRPHAQLPQAYNCVRTARQLLASTRYGHLRFARLRADAPPEVRAGSSTGSEIGAYGRYGEAHRVANLRNAMAEYLPAGVSAHVVFRT